jgi:hypothetical protein
MKNSTRRPSPALLVAVMALIAALAGTAVAADPVANTAVSKKKTKKIAKKVAKKQIKKRAPGLSVANAQFSGAPAAYAHVNEDGTVDPNESRNVSSANVSQPLGNTGLYCLTNLPDFKTVQATQHGDPDTVDTSVTVHTFRPPVACGDVPGTDLEVQTIRINSNDADPEAFDLWLGN